MKGLQKCAFQQTGLITLGITVKIGGPAGVGALLVRPGCALSSLLKGGGQEQGRRSGTENLIGIAGFGAAANAAVGESAHYAEMAGWRDAFEARVMSALPSVQIFGNSAPRLGNTSCIAAGPKTAETMIIAFDIAGVAVSAGAACSSGKVQSSHVLRAMGAGDAAAHRLGGIKPRCGSLSFFTGATFHI